jgi:hypothetical protein
VVLAPLDAAQRPVEVEVDLVAAAAVAAGHGPLSPAVPCRRLIPPA